jgi:hypothetical protein
MGVIWFVACSMTTRVTLPTGIRADLVFLCVFCAQAAGAANKEAATAAALEAADTAVEQGKPFVVLQLQVSCTGYICFNWVCVCFLGRGGWVGSCS